MRWTQSWILSLLILFAFATQAVAEVKLGSDNLVAQAFEPLRGKRVGLLTNPSGINQAGIS
ncbi:MAG: DUF1343 domain-containing protein, partial [Verrucomicrobiota bacterium]